MSRAPGRVVAVCGKGGAGKTSVSAMLLRAVSRQRPDWRLLAVDADPAGGLHLALGVEPARTLNDLRREVAAEAAGGKADRAALGAAADYRLMELLEERGNLALLALGRPEEKGCYCALNSLLRQSLEGLARGFDLTLIDAEAGVEQVNRRVMRAVTHLLLVSDPTRKGVRVAAQVRDVARRSVGEHRAGLLINRVSGDPAVAEGLAAEVPAELLGLVPEDPAVGRYDAEGRSLLEMPGGPAPDTVSRLLLGGGFL